MAQDRKKQVSGEIPFHFMQEMGHSPRAMEQFFDLPYQARHDSAAQLVSAYNRQGLRG